MNSAPPPPSSRILGFQPRVVTFAIFTKILYFSIFIGGGERERGRQLEVYFLGGKRVRI